MMTDLLYPADRDDLLYRVIVVVCLHESQIAAQPVSSFSGRLSSCFGLDRPPSKSASASSPDSPEKNGSTNTS